MVSANGDDSERHDAHGIAGMIARVEQLEADSEIRVDTLESDMQ